ncbi:Zn(2)-C6 fungal-type domain-containing protein [Balamuthia mandrillaris]
MPLCKAERPSGGTTWWKALPLSLLEDKQHGEAKRAGGQGKGRVAIYAVKAKQEDAKAAAEVEAQQLKAGAPSLWDHSFRVVVRVIDQQEEKKNKSKSKKKKQQNEGWCVATARYLSQLKEDLRQVRALVGSVVASTDYKHQIGATLEDAVLDALLKEWAEAEASSEAGGEKEHDKKRAFGSVTEEELLRRGTAAVKSNYEVDSSTEILLADFTDLSVINGGTATQQPVKEEKGKEKEKEKESETPPQQQKEKEKEEKNKEKKQDKELQGWSWIGEEDGSKEDRKGKAASKKQKGEESDPFDKFISEFISESSPDVSLSKESGTLRDEARYAQTKTLKYSTLGKSATDRTATWASITVPPSRQQSARQLKVLIRKGVPDSRRAEVWKAVVGYHEFIATNKDHYEEEVVGRVFGHRIPTKFYLVPSFGGQFTPQAHYLTQDGAIAASRILCALAMEHPEVDYVPSLPDLVCIFLLFMPEAEAYVVSKLVLEESRIHRWFLCTGKQQHALFLLTFQSLIQKSLPKLFAHMKKLGVAVESFAEQWYDRLFVNSLPYQTVLRVVDTFLNEGVKVLYRIGLGILRTYSRHLLQCTNKDSFVGTLQQLTCQYEDTDRLVKKAFSETYLSRRHTHAIDAVNRPRVSSVNEPEYKPYYRPKVTDKSSVLTELEFEALWSLLPSRFCIHDPKLWYTSEEHGSRLTALLGKCSRQEPAILIIKSKNNSVFGAFVADGLQENREGYYGTADCMLFTLRPTVAKYAGRADGPAQFVSISSEDGLLFGEGKGLYVDKDLQEGSSEYCETYQNKQLHGDNEGSPEFECLVIEVWGFV